MANEAEYTYASPVTVSSSSAALAAAAVSGTASVVTGLSSANHSNYPLADAMLTFTATNSISSASATINLYRRDMNVNGAGDSPPLSTGTADYYMAQYVGTFVAGAAAASFSTAQNLEITGIPLSKECEFYIENRMNSPVGADWVLVVKPKSIAPGA